MRKSGPVLISHREGENAYSLIKKLWPINRSLSGDGVRETLAILKRHIGIQFKLKSVGLGQSVLIGPFLMSGMSGTLGSKITKGKRLLILNPTIFT